MDRWLTTSPFWAVGIYIAGSMRSCKAQPNLDAAWVARQSRNGWRLLPLTVGRQASCSTQDRYTDRISANPARKYAAARAQGRAEAASSVRAARALGIPARSTLWYDIEHYDIGNDGCRRSTLRFLSAWTTRLHSLGYRSGVYSSASSGIAALDHADEETPGTYVMPDRIWFGWSNGRANTVLDPDWGRPSSWARNRVHQYQLDTSATYGGVTIHIDRNFMEVGGGSAAPRAPRTCGVRVDFPRYRHLVRGKKGAQVMAAQCLLRQKRLYRSQPMGLRYNRATYRAVRQFQSTRSLRVTGKLTRGTWTALLSDGPAPLVKVGSARHAVRRVQRALNAAGPARLEVTGVFDGATTRAVRAYQKGRRLRHTGVVAEATWTQLKSGLR